ncbi:MAG: lamin tail domain-containing protein, partial [Verrucomicrobiales bacterium]|nr:lamin tail domain-containing protein [Verrucomicrobiales bacterium]
MSFPTPLCAGLLLVAACVVTRAEFTAYNDIVSGPGTDGNATTFDSRGTRSGLLRDIVTGEATGVELTVSDVGVNHESQTNEPAAGTDAGDLFLGVIDFTSGSGNSLALSGADTFTYSFSGMAPASRYEFAGTVCRGNDGYTDRWTLVTLVGADSFTAAHSVGNGTVTAGLAANQVALWVGANHQPSQGFVAQWKDIVPGADGEVEVVCRQYTGPTPGVGSGTATGSKGYGLNCMRLVESFIAGQPVVVNTAATEVGADSARIGGDVTDAGSGTPEVRLFWGVVDGGGVGADWENVLVLGNRSGVFSSVVGGLSPATTYYFRAYAENGVAGSWATPTASFVTAAVPPVVVNRGVSELLAASALVSGEVTEDGGVPPVVTLYYGAVDGGTDAGAWASSVDLGVQSGPVESALAGLAGETVYFFRFRAVNSGGEVWSGAGGVFTTPAVRLPVVVNRAAEGVTGITAVLGGEVTDVGGEVPTVTIYYGRTDGGTSKGSWEASVPAGDQGGVFSRFVGSLVPESGYFFRALAGNGAGEVWAGGSLSFATPAYTPPTIVINEIHYEEDDTTVAAEFIEICNLSAEAVDVSGWSFSDGVDFVFPDGTSVAANGYLVVAEDPGVMQSKFGVSGAYGPWGGKLRNDGEVVRLRDRSWNVLDSVDYAEGFPWPTVGSEVGVPLASPSIQLINPLLDTGLGGSWRSGRPTPGAANVVVADNAAPQIRKVGHVPEQPGAGVPALVSAKVTDPHGVAAVMVEYQVVAPGSYEPGYLAKSSTELANNPNGPLAPNPAYTDPANWTVLAMVDDGTGGDLEIGDGVFSAMLPGQVSRALVRYRIVVEDELGESVRVPYADDPGLNFAYFCYDGVPDYVARRRSVLGVPHTYPAEVMNSVPVYHLLTNDADFAQCVGYSSGDRISSGNYDARSAYNWTGTFVYNGKVYDHIGYRLRQRNARYSGGGKRSFKFRFNRGHHIQLHDMDGDAYPTKWRSLATHKLRGSRGNSTWGIEQAANHEVWNMMGVPAPFTHWTHF